MSKTVIYFILMILCVGVTAGIAAAIEQEIIDEKWNPLLYAVLAMSAVAAILFMFSGIISSATGLK